MKNRKKVLFLTAMTFMAVLSIGILVILIIDSFKKEVSFEVTAWETVEEAASELEEKKLKVEITKEEAFNLADLTTRDFIVRKVLMREDLESSEGLRVTIDIPKVMCFLVGVITVEVRDQKTSVESLISTMAIKAMESGADLMWISDITEVKEFFSYAGHFSLDPRMGVSNDVGIESSLLIYATIYRVL